MPPPPFPHADPSRLRDDLLAAAGKLGRAVSDMLNGLDGPADQVNINAEAAAQQLKALVEAAKLAALSTNDQGLLDAGKRVAEAVARMLEASRDLTNDPESMEAKRALQEAIASLKGASGYLQGAVNGLLTDPASEQLLLESAKQVADAIKRLAGNANRYAGDLALEDRKEIVMLAKRAADGGQNVQDTAKMLAPLIVDPTAKQQLLSAGKMASADCELLLKAAAAKLPGAEMSRLADAARAVNEALAQMLNAADTAGSRAAQNQVCCPVVLVSRVYCLLTWPGPCFRRPCPPPRPQSFAVSTRSRRATPSHARWTTVSAPLWAPCRRCCRAASAPP
jgi:hypothetical protein